MLQAGVGVVVDAERGVGIVDSSPTVMVAGGSPTSGRHAAGCRQPHNGVSGSRLMIEAGSSQRRCATGSLAMSESTASECTHLAYVVQSSREAGVAVTER